MNRKFDLLCWSLAAIFLSLFLLIQFAGCTHQAGRIKREETAVSRNEKALETRVQENVTGALDALHMAPTNPPTNLASALLQDTQQIVGLPVQRIPVGDILAGLKPAVDDLQRRFDQTEALLKERSALNERLQATEARLVEMGKLYEAEKNKNIVKRVWHSLVATLGIGGVIALCVFFPAIIPVLINCVGWLVGKVPQLASLFGVVSKKAFDAVVTGVEKVRDGLKTRPDEKAKADAILKEETDGHELLIKSRKVALEV